MIRALRLLVVAGLLAAFARPSVGAQSATFAGAVARDTLSHGLSGAVVSIPDLKRSDTSDAQGEFKLTGLRSGRFAVVIRRIGFKPMVDTVLLVSGTSVEREYVMDATAVELDSVRITAKTKRLLSPHMAQFEDHRKYATGGHFLADSIMRLNESRTFGDMLTSYLPGIHLYLPYPKIRPTMEYLSSTRQGKFECPVTLIIDGLRRFSGQVGEEVPDMTGFQIINYAAVEYYAGGASVPLEYNQTGGRNCGVLVLWSREKL